MQVIQNKKQYGGYKILSVAILQLIKFIYDCFFQLHYIYVLTNIKIYFIFFKFNVTTP